jgi:hypothetical protein
VVRLVPEAGAMVVPAVPAAVARAVPVVEGHRAQVSVPVVHRPLPDVLVSLAQAVAAADRADLVRPEVPSGVRQVPADASADGQGERAESRSAQSGKNSTIWQHRRSVEPKLPWAMAAPSDCLAVRR